jgi:hypothetical protein
VETRRKKERQNETQIITKFVGKTSLGPSYFAFFVEFSFLDTHLMPYYAETGHSHPLSFPDTRLMPYYAETGHSHPLCEGLYGYNSNKFEYFGQVNSRVPNIVSFSQISEVGVGIASIPR